QEPRSDTVLRPLVPQRPTEYLLLRAVLSGEIEALRHEADDLPIDLRDLVSQPFDFRLAQRKPSTSIRSRIAIAAAFSTTGTARDTIHVSCLPMLPISSVGTILRSPE